MHSIPIRIHNNNEHRTRPLPSLLPSNSYECLTFRWHTHTHTNIVAHPKKWFASHTPFNSVWFSHFYFAHTGLHIRERRFFILCFCVQQILFKKLIKLVLGLRDGASLNDNKANQIKETKNIH